MLFKGVVRMLESQVGQALLIVVLVMVVALTIGLSVASRTITNLRNTQEQASSQKALSAAEAGVEQAIKNSANVAGSLNTTTNYNTTITQVSGTTAFKLNGGIQIPKNDAIYVWLTPYSTIPANLWQNPWNGTLSIYWGDNNPCDSSGNAAIEVSVISGNKTAPVMNRYGFDPYSTRRSNNNLSIPTAQTNTISGRTFYCRTNIVISNGLLLRINPLYSASFMAASGSIALPSQGSIISSTGTTDTNTNNSTTRKVTVFQGYPEIPAEFFPYILFQP